MRENHYDSEFSAFVESSLRQLVVFGLTLTPNENDAWDLTQDALLRVYTKWSEITSPLAYTHRVMARLNIDQLRRKTREVIGDVPDSADSPVYIDPPDRRLLDALAQLTAQQRTAMAMRYWLDLDVTAIADAMNCSEGTVRSHLSRAGARLREHKEIKELGREE